MTDIELDGPVAPRKSPSLSPDLHLSTLRTRSRSQGESRQHTGVPVRREHTLTAEDYVSRIFEYLDKPIEHALYPGENFYKLATFLSKALVAAPLSQPGAPNESLSYATIYLLQAVESATSPKSLYSEDLGSVDDLRRLDESLRRKAQGGTANQLLFLRGFLSPEWLCKVGWFYTVDPEYFRRHLDLSLFSHQQWFSAPSLPSTSNTITQLRITTIARRTPRVPDVEIARKEAQEEMAMYLQNLSGQELRGNLGDSIVRKLNLHDDQYFSLEQDISITFCKAPKSWTVIIWFDSGKDLTLDRSEGPWSKWHFELISTIRNEPNKAIHTGESGRRSLQVLKRAQKFQQNRAVLNLDYDRLLEDFDNLDDAFHCVTPIFKYKATAENQFLNLIDSVLQQSLDKIRFNDNPTQETQYIVDLHKHHANFAYHKEILESHARSIGDNLRALRAHGGPQWPRGSNDPPKTQSAIDTLLEDFTWLEKRASSLSALCDRAMQDIHDKSTLGEALRSNNQAEQVNRLNTLATFISVFYLPLSFTSGFFGMNFALFGQGQLPLWIYPVVSVPILLISLFFVLNSKNTMALIWEKMGYTRKKKNLMTMRRERRSNWTSGTHV